MDTSAPLAPPKEKRKYDRGHFLRVRSPFINSDSSTYEAASSKSSSPSRSVCPPSALPTGRSINYSVTDHMPSTAPATNDSEAAAASANAVTFVVSTTDDFKAGHRPSVQRSHHPSPLLLRNCELAGKRPRLGNTAPTEQRPTLKPSRPLANSDQVNSDVWQTVLGYCEPKLLLEAKTINSAFYRLLSDRSAIWKQSRQNHFGPDMPDCPRGLTEQQYVDLLAGRGCQSRTCPNENTARVFWTFQVRLCAKCFQERTMRVGDWQSLSWAPH